MISTGVVSVAAVGLYMVYGVASDWRKTSQEVKSLNLLLSEIDNATNTSGVFTGITLSTLPVSNYTSALNLIAVNSPKPRELHFEYKEINSRNCTEFMSKMISSSKNIIGNVNGKEITKNNLLDIATACNGNYGKNDVTIVLNKELPAYTLDTVVASVNLPDPPPPDVVVPLAPTPTPLPNFPSFVPTTANPIVYGITGAAPVYPVIPPSGGGGTLIPGGGGASLPSIPSFTPPSVPDAGGPVAAPPDEIDGEVLPPIITTETRSVSCGAGYTGTINQERTKKVLQGSGAVSYSPWVEVSNSCVPLPPAGCDRLPNNETITMNFAGNFTGGSLSFTNGTTLGTCSICNGTVDFGTNNWVQVGYNFIQRPEYGDFRYYIRNLKWTNNCTVTYEAFSQCNGEPGGTPCGVQNSPSTAPGRGVDVTYDIPAP